MINPKIRLIGSTSIRNDKMKKYVLAGIMGCALGVLISVKVAGPVLAQDTETKKTIYEQLDLFGDILSLIHISEPTRQP